MKKVYALLLTFPCSLAAQEFTPPDTAAIRKNQVQSVKIYYTGTGVEHHLTKEYRYDRQGHRVFEREGNAGYYYAHTYNKKGFLVSSTQRSMNGDFIQRWNYDTYEDGKPFHVVFFASGDSINPSRKYTQNRDGRVLEEAYYHNGKMTLHRTMEWNGSDCIHLVDSVPGSNVKETRSGKCIRQSVYSPDNQLVETWTFGYEEQVLTSSSHIRPGKKTDVYAFEYDARHNLARMTLNGKTASEKERDEWLNTWKFLLPRTYEDESAYDLPTADPIYAHELKRDKNGNIIEDKVARAESWSNEKPVVFTYEYTHYTR